jgi:hypothetical protein
MHFTKRLRAFSLVALAALIAVGAAFATTNRTHAAPANQSVPTVSGNANVGSTLTANPGTWNGSTPMSFQYQWQVCGANGNSCHAITGATDNTYVLKSGDAGNTIRVHVIAGNSDGSAAATSAPTASISSSPAAGATTTTSTPAANGCPKTTAGATSVAAADVASPARLQITGFVSNVHPITSGTGSFSVQFTIADTCGQPVSGAQVYATAVPYHQFNVPAMVTTDSSGHATMTFQRQKGFPAARTQRLLVMFVRASRQGDPALGGISTRRLVSLAVNLGK